MALSKSFNNLTLIASAIAGIVGSGWLLGPLACAKIAGPAAIVTWLLAGMLMMIVASTFVILTRALPIVGGTVRFFQLSYGHFAGFSFSWVTWLAWVAVPPIETMALLQYSDNYIPGLMTTGVEPVLTPVGMLVAMACMIVISIINSYGVRLYSKANYIFLAFKLFIPAFTVVLLFGSHFHPHNFVAEGGFIPHGIKSIFSALPMAGVIYSFIGFNPAIQLAAESKNPGTAIPVAIFGSLAICIIIYTFVQIAFIGALPSVSLSHGWSGINFLGDNGPFAGLLAAFGFIWFVKALYLDATISPFGTAMVQAMATGRLTYAMSENGYFPKWFMHTNKYHSPARAILFNIVVGFAFFLPFPSWQHMVGFLVSCLVIGYVIGPMSLMILMRTEPKRFLNYPRWLIQGVCLLAFYICNLIIFWTGWDVIAKVSIVFAIGYVVLGARILWHKVSRKSLHDLNILRGSWVIIYMVGMTIISYLSSFGGCNVIPFGIDFLVMAMFTIGVYALARYLAAYTTAPINVNSCYLQENTVYP